MPREVLIDVPSLRHPDAGQGCALKSFERLHVGPAEAVVVWDLFADHGLEQAVFDSSRPSLMSRLAPSYFSRMSALLTLASRPVTFASLVRLISTVRTFLAWATLAATTASPPMWGPAIPSIARSVRSVSLPPVSIPRSSSALSSRHSMIPVGSPIAAHRSVREITLTAGSSTVAAHQSPHSISSHALRASGVRPTCGPASRTSGVAPPEAGAAVGPVAPGQRPRPGRAGRQVPPQAAAPPMPGPRRRITRQPVGQAAGNP